MELTAPVEVPVVGAGEERRAGGAEARSLPSMRRRPRRLGRRFRRRPSRAPFTANSAIAEQRAHAGQHRPARWRLSPTMRAERAGNENGIARMRQISNRLVSAVGFSNGCAELALKNPPPLVPSSLDGLLRGDRPPGSAAVPPVSVVTSCEAVEVLDDAAGHERRARRAPRGSRMRSGRAVRSTRSCRAACAASEAADQGDRDRDADGRGDEVLHGEPDHLARCSRASARGSTTASSCW